MQRIMDTLTVRSNSHCVSSQAERDIQMAEKRDAPKDSFFQYYEKYIVAKEREDSLLLWLNAVYCRQKLQELGSIPHANTRPEEETMQKLFGEVLTKQQISTMYKELLKDSKAFPIKS
jgi:hypothetical protein